MTITEIQEFISKHSELGLNLEEAAREVPKLQSKILNWRASEVATLKALEIQMDAKKKDRWIYYSGKGEPDAYKKEPFDLKVLKTDMDIFIDADRTVAELRSRIEMQKIKVSLLDDYLKSLGQRTFLIRSILDARKFESGLV